MDLVPHPILARDEQGVLLMANLAFAGQYGLTVDEIVGRKQGEIHKNRKDVALFLQNDLEVIKTGQSKMIQEQNFNNNEGNSRVQQVHKIPFEIDKTNAALTVTVDITDLKQSTAELDKSHRILQKQHLQLQETQAQLIQSEKIASLGTIVAGVAHEINNPLGLIQIRTHNLTNLLQNFKDYIFEIMEDEDKQYIQIFNEKFESFFKNLQGINEGFHRIKTIVADLRTSSRMSDSEQKMANVEEGLESTVRLLKTQYKTTVEFICDFQANTQILCWPARLNQVFMNMMVNACYAIESKQKSEDSLYKGSLTIQTLHENEFLVIRFQDTGCGMTKEVQEKIFEPFFTTKPEGIGTGIGLSITYGIIEKHLGKIKVDSEVGKGTTITIYLPLRSEVTDNQ